jgi:arginine N-succinyltransferase
MDIPFLIRSVREEDLDQLFALSKMVYFINLPADRKVLKAKIKKSRDSFSGVIEDKFAREYILVLEDIETRTVVGTSMVIARHGNPHEPHMYFELIEKKKYSETIHSGIIHRVLRLKFDFDGPTEIGGLVIHPNYRSHEAKLGRQLSFSRFLFIKMKRRWFKNYILSELMPPLTDTGESILWEALGRKFTNLSYMEADLLSRKNKEFVTSLFPKGDIYTCLLSGEARDAIGQVGPGALPVRHMLEKIGFRWRQHIDPFDGGPHYWAETDKISLIHDAKKHSVRRELLKRRNGELGLAALMHDDEFRCIQTPCHTNRGRIQLPKIALDVLGTSAGEKLYYVPLKEPPRPEAN